MYLNHCIAEVFIHFIDVGIVRGYYDVILGPTYVTIHILGPGLKGGARTSLKEATKMEMCKRRSTAAIVASLPHLLRTRFSFLELSCIKMYPFHYFNRVACCHTVGASISLLASRVAAD